MLRSWTASVGAACCWAAAWALWFVLVWSVAGVAVPHAVATIAVRASPRTDLRAVRRSDGMGKGVLRHGGASERDETTR